MSENRNEFLESLQFDISSAIEEYSKYENEYKDDFYKQAIDVHKAIQEAFPGLDFHTVCRIKSFDSTLGKAKRKTLDKVFDIHGMKHIIHSVHGDTDEAILMGYCYKLKDFLEKYYSQSNVVISRLKDYITSPKENGYEAIHLSGVVVSQNNRRFETQIKTAEMEKIAKYGSANHAEKYKPRDFGRYPLAKVPQYMTIITSNDGTITSYRLTREECFQYFFNRPYKDYLNQKETRE